MTVKEFLLTTDEINQKAIAMKMWPSNTDAPSYLYKKLNNLNGRSWTTKDSEKALQVLKELGSKIDSLEL